MKQLPYLLFLFAYPLICAGQSKQTAKLRLTQSHLEELRSRNKVVTTQDLDKSDSGKEALMNFNPILLDFSKNVSLKILEDLEDLSKATIFTVYKPDSSLPGQKLWSINSGVAKIGLTTVNVQSGNQAMSYADGMSEAPVLNTYIQTFNPKNAATIDDNPFITLGDSIHNRGMLAEILVYDSVVRGKTRQSIESNLALKYGITLINGKNYISSDNKIVYPIENGSDFIYHIAGIGKDLINGLNQKQSHSTQTGNLITMGVGEIVKSNADNTANIDNQAFLVWGDNNAPLKEDKTSRYPVSILQRKWLIKATGETVPGLNTVLELDGTDLFKDKIVEANRCLLLIDESGSGNFLSKDTRYYRASSLENNKAVFSNIKWDANKSGTDVFSFAVLTDLEVSLIENKPLNCDSKNNGVLRYEVKGGVAPYTMELKEGLGVIKQWKSSDKIYPENLITQLRSGKYSITVTDYFGTKREAAYELVNPLPAIVELGADKNFEFEQKEISLEGAFTSDRNVTYKWTSDSGFEDNKTNITITKSGLYTLTATTDKGCVSSDSILIGDSFIKSFTLYPNRTTDGNYTIYIQLDEPHDFTVQVFDLTAKMLFSTKALNKSTYTIPGKQINTAGVYYVVLQTGSVKIVKKLIVD